MEKYIIKEISGNDIISYKRLSSVMFKQKNVNLGDVERYMETVLHEDSGRKDGFIRLGAFYDGKLFSAATVNCFDGFFDGKLCKIGGIGDVISDFNAPFKGGVRQIFAEAFRFMRKHGEVISYLYPFEESYYRQYGYGEGCRYALWNIPVEKFYYEQIRSGKNIYFDGSPEMCEDIKKVYMLFAGKNNLFILKNAAEWNEFFERKAPYVTDNNSYVHYNDEGAADAFMSFKVRQNEDGSVLLSVSELWYSGYKPLMGILSYFENQKGHCDRIELALPAYTDISPLLNSAGYSKGRETVMRVTNRGMCRVVDVAEILKTARYKGKGSLCIGIYGDSYAPWNNDCFTVEYGDTVSVKRGGNPDIEMSINTFSALISGRMDPGKAEIFPDVRILNCNSNIGNVFYRKCLWTEQLF